MIGAIFLIALILSCILVAVDRMLDGLLNTPKPTKKNSRSDHVRFH